MTDDEKLREPPSNPPRTSDISFERIEPIERIGSIERLVRLWRPGPSGS